MRLAVITGIVLFVLLFLLTTIPQSPQARKRAEKENFSAVEIDQGLRISYQRSLLFWARVFVVLGFYTWFVFSGRARRFTDMLNGWTGGRWWLTLPLLAAFCFVTERLLVFPLRIVSLANLEAWGLTNRKITDWEWLADYGKAVALSGAVSVVLLIGFYFLIRRFPRWWWVTAAVLSSVAGMAFAYVLPVWIDPLFNTFEPLRDPSPNQQAVRAGTVALLASSARQGPLTAMTALKAGKFEHPGLARSIRELAAKAGIPVQEVLIKDASRQNNFSNAYFTGFGATRRIVLYDNLLNNHPTKEIESIVAHEIGHWQHHHIYIGLALAGLGSFLGFFVLSRILRWAVKRSPFHLHSPGDPAGWPLIALLAILGTWLVLPLQNAVSRHFERQADAASLELAGRPQAFIATQKRLARDNKQNVAPLPLSVWIFSTHPTTVDRIQMARQWRGVKQ